MVNGKLNGAFILVVYFDCRALRFEHLIVFYVDALMEYNICAMKLTLRDIIDDIVVDKPIGKPSG